MTDTNRYIDQENIFNKTKDEVVAIHKAIKDPEANWFVMEAFGMGLDWFKMKTPASLKNRNKTT